MAKYTVDCKEMAQGDMREKTAVVNAFGRKLGNDGVKATLLSHSQRWSHHCGLSPVLHHKQRTNKDPRQGGPRSAGRSEH